MQAPEEAAINRLYGLIHYRPTIDCGVQQGEEVGNMSSKIKKQDSF